MAKICGVLLPNETATENISQRILALKIIETQKAKSVASPTQPKPI